MSYPSLMGYFRDPFYGDMWHDFEKSPFQWGFTRPRSSLLQTRPQSANPYHTTGMPYVKQRQVPKAQKTRSSKTNEKVQPDCKQSLSASDRRVGPPRTRLQLASKHFAPDPTAETSCEHRLVPTAQNKKSRKTDKNVKQDEQSPTSPEFPDNCAQNEIETVANAKQNEADHEENLERTDNAEGRRGEYRRSRSFESSDPVYSGDKTEFEEEEHTSQTDDFSESLENTEQPKETDEEERRDDEQEKPLNQDDQEHELDNVATNEEVRDPVGNRLAAIDSELSKAKELSVRVQKFNGVKADKEYLCLEELLLRCILSLDLIGTEGCEEVRSARRAAVKEIQSIINELESKV